MAVIEICDVCGKQVSEKDGISLKCSDMNGLSFIGAQPMRGKRSYKIRVCNKCIDNIKDYCREHNDRWVTGKPEKSGNYMVRYNGTERRDDYTTSDGGHWWNTGNKNNQDKIEYDPTSFKELGL